MPTASNPVPPTAADVVTRRAAALRVIHRGAVAAYGQGAAAVAVCAVMAHAGDWVGALPVLGVATVVVALGAWLGRAKAAAPAALLVVVVLASAAWLLAGGAHALTVLLAAGVAWQFREAFTAARALAALDERWGQPR